VYCGTKDLQVCCGSLREGLKEARKNLGIKKIVEVNIGSTVYFS
jgi:hypothetical protein